MFDVKSQTVRSFGMALTLVFAQAGIMLAAAPPKTLGPFGRPKQFIQGKKKMYGIWYQDGVWRLRTTSGKRVRVEFLGSVGIDRDKITPDYTALDRERRRGLMDLVRISKNRRTMIFKFQTVGKIDGIDFKVGPKAKTVTFKLRTDDDDDPRFILIGAKGVHPAKGVFTLPAHPKVAESKQKSPQ